MSDKLIAEWHEADRQWHEADRQWDEVGRRLSAAGYRWQDGEWVKGYE